MCFHTHTPLLRFSGLRISLFSFLMLLSTISVHAQVEYPPDYMDDSPKMFYENKGQITDSYDYSSFPIEDPGNGAYIDANQNVNGISDRDDSFIARFILTTQMTGTELQNIDDNNLIVYPNPTGSILNIKIRGNNEIEKFNIYNSIGMCVLSCEMTNSDKYLNTSIDVSSLPAGIYNIILKSTEGIISTSFLKQ